MARRQNTDSDETPPFQEDTSPPGGVQVNQESLAAQQARLAEYAATHPQGGGFLGGVLGPVLNPLVDVVSAAADKVGDVASAVYDVAQGSVIAQAVAAAATGGISLLAQEAASGGHGPLSSVVSQAVNDPLALLSQLPGEALTGLGAPGLIADLASGAGAATAAAFGEDSAIGKVGAAVHDGVEATQQAAREHPIESLEVIAAIAAASTGVGGPLAAALIKDVAGEAVESLMGGDQPPQQSGNTGIVPPPPPVPQQSVPLILTKSSSSKSKRVAIIVGASLLAVGGVASVALLSSSSEA